MAVIVSPLPTAAHNAVYPYTAAMHVTRSLVKKVLPYIIQFTRTILLF